MSLRTDIRDAVDRVWDSDLGPSVPAVVDAVWGVLEDKIGSAQEALFNQLTMTRTELEASRRREADLRGTIRSLQAQIVAAQDEED